MLLYDHSPYKKEEDLVDIINFLKRKGTTQLREQTLCHAPHFEDMILDQTFDYYYDGNRIVINAKQQACFRLNYLYVKSVPYRKYIYLSNWVKASMIECIENDYIKPFLLFINGRCVPWEYINIIFTAEDYYILVDTEETNWNQMFTHLMVPKMLVLYDGIEYIHNSNAKVTDQTLFSFDENGMLNLVNPTIVINNIGTMVSTITYSTKNNYINAEKIMEWDNPLAKYRLQPNSTIIFKNNLLDIESVVRYDTTLLTLNNGEPSDEGDTYTCKIFINKNSFRSVDNIIRADPSVIQQYVKDKNLNGSYPSYLDDLQIPYDLFMTNDKKYSDNFVNAVNTIMSYNAWLFNFVYKVNSNVDIMNVKGQYLLDREKDGIFKIPRAHANGIQYCMIMVNGELYKYTYNLKYNLNFWEIPTAGVNPEDDVEMFFFKNVNNDIFTLIPKEDSPHVLVNEDIINDDINLFAHDPYDPKFNYPRNGLQHFPVEYTLHKDENGLTKLIVPKMYYDKELTIAYKNRFVVHNYVVIDEWTEAYKIDLGKDFMFCNDYAKYMIFVNGRRISSEHYRLTLPVRETTPFYQFILYITLPVKQNDRIDVYYLPTLMKDIHVEATLSEDGLITISKDNINYPLSRDLYMVWVNGKKIPKSKIMDVDATHLRIIGDMKSTDTICVTKYIEDFDYLTPFFHDNISIWTKIMCQLSADEMAALLGKTTEELTNLEPSIYQDALPILSIMWELIRDQYMANTLVDITNPFVYDYIDVDKFIPDMGVRDDDGNIIILAADHEREDTLDENRPYP